MTCSSNTTCKVRTGFVLAGLTLAALFALPASGGDTRLDGARAAARAALERRDPIAAEVVLRKAVDGGLPLDAVRAQLGEALLRQGERAEARRVLGGGAFTPDSAGLGWRVRGQLELAEGNLGGAAQAFDRALEVIPGDADLWTEIASLRFSGGEQAQAVAAAAHAVELDPANPRALALRGMLIREQFGLVASLPWFEAALHIRPDDPGLLAEYAATLGDMGEYRAMLIVCRKIAQVDPKNPRPFFLQAVLAARAGKTDLARAILLKTGTALRDVPAAILLNGVLEYRSGNVNLAVEHFDRLVRLQPENMQGRALLARALERMGDVRQVARRFDADAHAPYASPYLLATVGQAWIRLGDRSRGAVLLDRARLSGQRPPLALRPDQPLGALALRYAEAPQRAAVAVPYIRGLLAAGQRDAAQDVADRLRDANAGAAEAHLLAGDVRIVRGDVAGALADYEDGAAIRFNEPVLRRMDAALRALGRHDEADGMTSRYLAQNPSSIAAMKLLAAAWSDPERQDARARLADALAARGQVAYAR
ncbi:tetratricopeptide repeat protein [Novosphingobium sp. KCTC 2891]|uniref:tetratricopeptide repeat protein n=1 Tax=Novosphingobium sp. KCTC 2891 TaxID=2989730 RepID=UPI002222EF24|nr:tetratricopeptide repeat protein [Novosphingobium sp. KCTC 2891]MCW1381669.1 tetratricopeptide repeat protein [Novosphingobium sp. KCTC 2891]